MRLLPALLVVAACGPIPPEGATFIYERGEATVNVRAINDHDTFTADRVGEASYTENRGLRFLLVGSAGSLRVELVGVTGPGSYGANAAFVELTHRGRRVNSRPQGGVCDVVVRRADDMSVSGNVTCVGLGSHSGRGYDVAAPFVLEAGDRG